MRISGLRVFAKIFYALLAFVGLGLNSFGQEARIICQNAVQSGEKLPIIVRFYDARGEIDTSVSQIVTLSAPGATFSKTSLRVIRGTGSVTSQVTSGADFVLSVTGFSGSKTVSVLSNRSYTTVNGRIDNAQTWFANSTYRINSDLKIGSNGSLTIEPGAQIFLDNDVNIEVDGGLMISGTEQNPVVFHPYDPSAWGGIEFNASDGEASLNWAIFTGGGGDKDRIFGHSDSQPVIKVVDVDFEMDNCFLIDNEGKGMSTHQSNNHITNSLLSRCDTGAEFRYSTTTIDGLYSMFMPDEDDIIADNDNDGIYFARASNSNPQPHQISNVVVYGVEDDGIDFNGQQEAVITNTFIGGVYDKGISTTDKVNIEVSYSIFTHCNDYGIAFKDVCEVVIDNCTFYGNNIDFRAYNNDLGHGEGKLEGYNLIFANTIDEIFDIHSGANYSIDYSISNTDALSGTGNLSGDPLLEDPENMDFRLQENSPAIDSGNPSDPLDEDGSRSDMGAVHYSALSNVELIPTEIDYYPVVEGIPNSNLEFLEIHNAGENAVDLTGFQVSGDITYQFTPGDILAAGDYLILVKDHTQWNINSLHIHQWTSGTLNDQGGQLLLTSPYGDPVFQFSWSSQAPWPQPTQYHHYSLSMIDVEEDYQNPSNWQLSRNYGGSPGLANTTIPDLDLIINEVMAENGGLVSDPTGNPYDWIELVNAGEDYVNLAGLWISNNSGDPDKASISVDNYDESTLAPGAYLVLWAAGSSSPGKYYLGFTLNAPSGQLLLSYPTQEGSFILDLVNYSGATVNLSYARIPDQSGTWTITTVPTPGEPNKQAFDRVVEGIVINEFMARNGSTYPDESGAYSDWIELYNTTTADLNLAGLYLSDDEKDPMKYRIPAGFDEQTTIPALGYLVFRADARPENGPLHADFQLASNGEELTLSQFFDGQLYVLDLIAYDVQMEDISYGRFPDGTDHWEYFNRPTPGARNSSNSSDLMAWDPNYPVSIYPNPANSVVQIKMGRLQADRPRVSLISMQGKTVKIFAEDQYHGQADNWVIQDSLSGIPPGLYYLVFDFKEKRLARKLMLMR